MTHPSTEERAQLSILELSATEMLHRCLTFRGCSCRKTARAGSPSSSLHSGSSASRIPNHQACLSLRARATPALARPQPALTHRDGVRTRCSNVRGGHGSGRYPHYRVIATFTLTGTTTTVISRISHLAPRARSGQRRDMRDARRDIWKERSRCARHPHSKGIAVSYWPLGADVTAAPRATILSHPDAASFDVPVGTSCTCRSIGTVALVWLHCSRDLRVHASELEREGSSLSGRRENAGSSASLAPAHMHVCMHACTDAG